MTGFVHGMMLRWVIAAGQVEAQPPPAASTVPAVVAPAEPPRGPEIAFAGGKGVSITSADERFGLGLGALLQTLYTYRHDPETRDEHGQGFEVRRARLRVEAHVFGRHNKLMMQLAFSPRDLQMSDGKPTRTPIFDAYVEFDHVRDATIRIGQYRVPFSRERRVPIAHLQFVDRSLANFEFNLDRDVGLDVRSDDVGGLGFLRYDVGVYFGEGRDAHLAGDFGMLYVARLEVLPLGEFDDYRQSDLKRHERPKLAIGAAYAFLERAKGNRGILGAAPSDGGTTDTHQATVDVVFKWRGLSVTGEGFYRHGTRRFGERTVVDDDGVERLAPREPPRNGIGWSGQVGYAIPNVPLEPMVRYSGVAPLGANTSLVRTEELGAGLQWLRHDNFMKVSVDYFRTYRRGDPSDGSDLFRVQLQLVF